MKQPTEQDFIHSLRCCLLAALILGLTGCATTPGPAFVQESVQTSVVLEQKGDIVNAVEELKIALTIDPDNGKIREDLTRLLARRDLEAEKHLKAGIALRGSNPAGARREFLRALRIRNDYREALSALRELQLSSSKDVIQGRLKREARAAAARAEEKERESDDDDMSTGDYSLDIAISALEDGDFATAIREFEKMKALYPNDPDIQAYLDKSWYNSGKAQYIQMEYKKALASFSKVRKGYENVDDYIAKCRQALKKGSKRH